MPDEVKEALTRIAATLPPVDWAEPDQLRRRGTTRRRTRVLTAVASTVAVVAFGVVAIRPWSGPFAGNTSTGGNATAAHCANGGVPAHVNLPERSAITINVYNGTSNDGLAATVAASLTGRGFTVRGTGNASEVGVSGEDQVAVIRYGPAEVGAAWVVLAYFPEAEMSFDVRRADETVDVVVGTRFLALPSVTEVNRNIAANGRAPAPPGTCTED